MDCKIYRIEIEESEPGKSLSVGTVAHIEACASCCALRDEQLKLSRMIGSLEVVSAPADFDFRLRARLAEVKSGNARSFAWGSFAPGARSLALAASLVVTLSVGLIVQQAGLLRNISDSPQEIAAVAPARTPVPFNTPSISARMREDVTTVSPSSAQTELPLEISKRNRSRMPSEFVSKASSSNEVIGTNDSGVRTTPPQILPVGIPDPLSQPSASIAVPVQASMKSATMIVEDAQAKPQTISLRPVSFGGQSVIDESDAKKMFLQTAHGIW